MFPTHIDEVYEFAHSIWVELFFATCFTIGYAALRSGHAKVKSVKPKAAPHIFKNVHAEAASSKPLNTISAWRAVQSQHLTPCDTVRLVVQSFLDTDSALLVDELVAHFSKHASNQSIQKSAAAALEVVARVGNVPLMESLFDACVRRLRMRITVEMHEVLLGGFASVGNEVKVDSLIEQIEASRQQVSARGYSLMLKGYLKNKLLDATLRKMEEMCAKGFNTPAFAVPEVLRVSRQSGRSVVTFQKIAGKVSLSTTTVATVLEDCFKYQDVPLARDVERVAKTTNTQLNFVAYEALLKLYTGVADTHAIELFEEACRVLPHVGEGLCITLLARCAEPRFLRFAELLHDFLRSRGQMTVVVYSAMMKVYSRSGMYDKACDLYDRLKMEGLEPDSMMHGCLMKFSAECGRTDLTKELAEKNPQKKPGAHYYMSLIRAACQEKDVKKAFTVLEQFRVAGGLDTAVCNAVIDVCVCAGDMDRARRFLVDMEKDGLADIISYNTILKGFCMRGDRNGANEVVANIERVGKQLNDISYNCLINLSASTGDLGAAWKIIETMEKKGIPLDQYTVSTLMKVLKRNPDGKNDIQKVLRLLDRHCVDVWCEEVLLITVVDAYIKHGEHSRIRNLLDSMHTRSEMQLGPHTYGSLIKAAGAIKDLCRCRELWIDMTEMRGITPTEVALGCMLDALVCNQAALEGLALMREWQNRVSINTVVYSTLIKGFNNMRDRDRAVEMWNELRAKKLPLNATVYNSILDVHARMGATQEISTILREMEADGCNPDDITRSIVAKSFCVSGELDKAMDVFRALSAKPSSNNVIVYNTILDGCVRHNRMELADELLQKMDDVCIAPSNFTLGIVVKMWGRRQQIEKAMAAIRDLPKKYNFVPNGPVKTCLFFACLRNNEIGMALEVFAELRNLKHLDAKMFSALISNCARVGQWEEAVSLVEEAYGFRSGKRAISLTENLDSNCLEQLMRCLSKQGQLVNCGALLLRNLANARVPISKRVWTLSKQDQIAQ